MRLDTMELSCGCRELAGMENKTAAQLLEFIKTELAAQADSSDGCDCDCEACEKCEHKETTQIPCAFVLWSDVATGSPGAALATLLTRKYRGSVTSTAAKVNPNTENTIKVWVFAPPATFLK